MCSIMEVREPVLVSTELDLSTVQVSLEIPELQVNHSVFHPSTPSNAEVTITFEGRWLQVDIKIEEKNLIYKFKTKKLPGAITICASQYENGKIILFLTKEKAESWAAALASGLETEKA
ncbi:uncharacterized protein LOC115224214 [Octopus sinensis]|uniref:Uncharacterized protein LOC115224214 n=1 Tax=Octopus sinensis TaxID=2607531 RepID=A0A6P7THJ1_9MOLL|nr:uncharacterized protein LOC115224214 [Octopus sinensis]